MTFGTVRPVTVPPPVGFVAFDGSRWSFDAAASEMLAGLELSADPTVESFVHSTAPGASVWLVASGRLTEARLWRVGDWVQGYLVQFSSLPAPALGVLHEVANALSVAAAAAALGEDAPEGTLPAALDRALAIIEFSRNEFSLAPTAPRERRDVSALVASVVEAVRVRFPDVEVSFAAHEQVVANVPAAALEQVVGNLVVNAARHGVPPVAVEVVGVGDFVTVSVRDEGPGVDPSALSAGTMSPSSPGTGLGLPIALSLASACGFSLSWSPGMVEVSLPRG